MSRKRYIVEDIKPAKVIISELMGNSQWVRDGMTLGAILSVWEELVGSRLAKYLRPVELKKKRLLVQVPDSTWLNEVVFHKEEIIQKVNEYLKTESIEDIKFYIK
ncbi:MAG: DUF721 domain-containing protein [Deltaproteobacteria bacterium]|nr:DUF721 domain-containing protein [Deltaproteobacteria bacterium]